MKFRPILFVSALVVACAAGTAQQALADSTLIRLDNLPSPSNAVSSPQTDDNVCVWVMQDGHSLWTLVECRPLGTVSNYHDYCIGIGDWNIDQIKVTIDGNNAFWLDQMQVFAFYNNVCTGGWLHVADFGIDNNVGYCLSTDSGDYSNAACTSWGTAGRVGSGPSYSQIWWDMP
jgi:hypothetical protein